MNEEVLQYLHHYQMEIVKSANPVHNLCEPSVKSQAASEFLFMFQVLLWRSWINPIAFPYT